MFDFLVATASKIKTAIVRAVQTISRELPRMHWLIVATFAAALLCII